MQGYPLSVQTGYAQQQHVFCNALLHALYVNEGSDQTQTTCPRPELLTFLSVVFTFVDVGVMSRREVRIREPRTRHWTPGRLLSSWAPSIQSSDVFVHIQQAFTFVGSEKARTSAAVANSLRNHIRPAPLDHVRHLIFQEFPSNLQFTIQCFGVFLQSLVFHLLSLRRTLGNCRSPGFRTKKQRDQTLDAAVDHHLLHISRCDISRLLGLILRCWNRQVPRVPKPKDRDVRWHSTTFRDPLF